VDYTRAGARWLLGATAHPGGEPLTRHTLDRLALPTGALVADVACGDGASLRLLGRRGLLGDGVDVEPRAVARAGDEGEHAVVGDAQALPLASGTFDAVLCECALSTFDEPARALEQMARVLRPGGRLALTDVLLRRDLATAEVVAAVDRLTAARSLPEYVRLVEAAGFRVERTEDRSADALALCRRLARRLRLVGASRHASTARACARAVEAGALSYGLVVAARA
jgi:ubiquinone/menaquinone biosynthesis C-methylase UbiE